MALAPPFRPRGALALAPLSGSRQPRLLVTKKEQEEIPRSTRSTLSDANPRPIDKARVGETSRTGIIQAPSKDLIAQILLINNSLRYWLLVLLDPFDNDGAALRVRQGRGRVLGSTIASRQKMLHN